jgi:MFS family permease
MISGAFLVGIIHSLTLTQCQVSPAFWVQLAQHYRVDKYKICLVFGLQLSFIYLAGLLVYFLGLRWKLTTLIRGGGVCWVVGYLFALAWDTNYDVFVTVFPILTGFGSGLVYWTTYASILRSSHTHRGMMLIEAGCISLIPGAYQVIFSALGYYADWFYFTWAYIPISVVVLCFLIPVIQPHDHVLIERSEKQPERALAYFYIVGVGACLAANYAVNIYAPIALYRLEGPNGTVELMLIASGLGFLFRVIIWLLAVVEMFGTGGLFIIGLGLFCTSLIFPSTLFQFSWFMILYGIFYGGFSSAYFVVLAIHDKDTTYLPFIYLTCGSMGVGILFSVMYMYGVSQDPTDVNTQIFVSIMYGFATICFACITPCVSSMTGVYFHFKFTPQFEGENNDTTNQKNGDNYRDQSDARDSRHGAQGPEEDPGA